MQPCGPPGPVCHEVGEATGLYQLLVLLLRQLALHPQVDEHLLPPAPPLEGGVGQKNASDMPQRRIRCRMVSRERDTKESTKYTWISFTPQLNSSLRTFLPLSLTCQSTGKVQLTQEGVSWAHSVMCTVA